MALGGPENRGPRIGQMPQGEHYLPDVDRMQTRQYAYEPPAPGEIMGRAVTDAATQPAPDPLASQQRQSERINRLSSAGMRGLGTGRNIAGYGWRPGPEEFYGGLPSQVGVARSQFNAPIFLPNQPNIPYSVVAARLQGVAEEQQKVNEALRKFNPFEDFENKLTRNPYRQQLDQMYHADINNWLMGVEDAGYELSDVAQSKFLQSQLGLDSLVRDYETMGTVGQANLDEMVKYQSDLKEGKTVDIPVSTRLADRYLNATEGGANVRELAALNRDWTAASSIPDLIHRSGLLKDMGGTLTVDAAMPYKDPKTGLYILGESYRKNYESAADAFADGYIHVYEGLDVTREDLREAFLQVAGEEIKNTLTAIKPNVGRSSAANQTAQKGVSYGYQYGPVNVAGDTPERKVAGRAGIYSIPGVDRTKNYDQIKLVSQGTIPKVVGVTNADGTLLHMQPDLIVEEPTGGGRSIVGYVQKDPSLVVIEHAGTGQPVWNEETGQLEFDNEGRGALRYYRVGKDGQRDEVSAAEYNRTLDVQMVPYDQNQQAILGAFDLTPEMVGTMIQQGRSGRAGSQPAPSQAAQNDPLGIR